MEGGLSGKWHNFYEALFYREFDRLNKVIDKIKRGDKTSDISFYLAEARAKQLLDDILVATDFWVEDWIEGEGGIPKIEKMMYAVEAIASYGGRGILRKNLPPSWTEKTNENLKKLSENLKKLSKYTKEFAQYVLGWSEIKLKEQPHHEVTHNPQAEAYALLYGFHGTVTDVTDQEYERYLERVKSGEYMLPGIVAVYEEIARPIDILQFLDPDDLKIFLKNYLAKDEFEWENVIYPQVKEGLQVLKEFLKRKGSKLVVKPARVQMYLQRIIELWKADLKEENIKALKSFASTIELRKWLAGQYEHGIELKLEEL